MAIRKIVKIDDDGTKSNTKDYPGFDLDSIQRFNLSTTPSRVTTSQPSA